MEQFSYRKRLSLSYFINLIRFEQQESLYTLKKITIEQDSPQNLVSGQIYSSQFLRLKSNFMGWKIKGFIETLSLIKNEILQFEPSSFEKLINGLQMNPRIIEMESSTPIFENKVV